MNRRTALLPLVALAVVACGQAQAQAQPRASWPPPPPAPTGWVSLASVGSGSGAGFAGFRVETSGRPLALHVACMGTGTLVVTFGRESVAGSTPATGQDAVVFPCSADAGATVRHEIAPDLGPGELTVSGGVVPGAGELAPSEFVVALEEAAP